MTEDEIQQAADDAVSQLSSHSSPEDRKKLRDRIVAQLRAENAQVPDDEVVDPEAIEVEASTDLESDEESSDEDETGDFEEESTEDEVYEDQEDLSEEDQEPAFDEDDGYTFDFDEEDEPAPAKKDTKQDARSSAAAEKAALTLALQQAKSKDNEAQRKHKERLAKLSASEKRKAQKAKERAKACENASKGVQKAISSYAKAVKNRPTVTHQVPISSNTPSPDKKVNIQDRLADRERGKAMATTTAKTQATYAVAPMIPKTHYRKQAVIREPGETDDEIITKHSDGSATTVQRVIAAGGVEAGVLAIGSMASAVFIANQKDDIGWGIGLGLVSFFVAGGARNNAMIRDVALGSLSGSAGVLTLRAIGRLALKSGQQ